MQFMSNRNDWWILQVANYYVQSNRIYGSAMRCLRALISCCLHWTVTHLIDIGCTLENWYGIRSIVYRVTVMQWRNPHCAVIQSRIPTPCINADVPPPINMPSIMDALLLFLPASSGRMPNSSLRCHAASLSVMGLVKFCTRPATMIPRWVVC